MSVVWFRFYIDDYHYWQSSQTMFPYKPSKENFILFSMTSLLHLLHTLTIWYSSQCIFVVFCILCRIRSVPASIPLSLFFAYCTGMLLALIDIYSPLYILLCNNSFIYIYILYYICLCMVVFIYSSVYLYYISMDLY